VAPLRERLAAATRGHYDLRGAGLDYPGASVGVATGAPGDSSDVVLARADEAMYVVKRQRRQGMAAA
jgi:diguanylate cyclase